MVDLKEGLAFINTNGDFIIGPGDFRVAGNNEVDVETGLIALLDIRTGKVGVFSMNDELIRDNDPNSQWTGNIQEMKTRGFFINFSFH